MLDGTFGKGVDKSPDNIPGTPELRQKVETALKNPELLRVLKILVHNQDDTDLLREIGDIAEKKGEASKDTGEISGIM